MKEIISFIVRNVKDSGGILIGQGGFIEYDWLLHRKKDFAGIIKLELKSQKEERFSVKRYAKCPNCFVIMPASEEVIKFNPLYQV